MGNNSCDDDFCLQLNISNTFTNEKVQRTKKKKKIANTESYLPAAKSDLFFIKNTSSKELQKSYSYEQKDLSETAEKKKFHTKKLAKNTNEGKWDSSKTHISSLFKSNPEIPHIILTDVKNESTSVFSSQTFADLCLHPHLVSCLKSRFNIENPTEVQARAIPPLLKKQDALIKSCTGSGKTLAYAVPIVQQLQEITPKIQRSDGIYALIIVPTRELALQSFECFSTLTKAFTWIVPGYLIGGEKKKSEKARIRKGLNILICTPGRLLDHLTHTVNLKLEQVQWLVIDEADRLLEQGYEESMIKILSYFSQETNVKCQSVLLSATLTKSVEHLAGMSLVNPVYIDVENTGNENMTDLIVPAQLKQHFIITPIKLKLVTLSAFLVDKCIKGRLKAIIFMSTQNSVDFHYIVFREVLKPLLKLKGYPMKILRLHGSLKQEERTAIFNKFRSQENGVLLSTDVAARGLDLPHVDWIIQYSAPVGPENYVHRVGRTARIGKEGNSLLFLIPSEIKFIDLLQKQKLKLYEISMSETLQSLLQIGELIKEKSKKPLSLKVVEELATSLQLLYEDKIYSEDSHHESAKNAFLSYVQAYKSYPKTLRDVIPFQLLHLGHVAKSFCLRESPSSLGCHYNNNTKKHQNERKIRTPEKQKRSLDVSEYASGFDAWKGNNLFKKQKKKK